MKTLSGLWFDPADPRPEAIALSDISSALSKVCRFSGQIKDFYSVGQHSILCYMMAKHAGLSKRIQLLCLLHDATEAYISDIPSPFKQLLKPQVAVLEDAIFNTIITSFGLPLTTVEEHKIMKWVDNGAFAIEDQVLRQNNSIDVSDTYIHVFNFSMEKTDRVFVNLFHDLMKENECLIQKS